MTQEEKRQTISHLVDALCENRCQQADLDRLESLLLNDEDAQWHYLCQMQLHAALAWNESSLEQYSAVKLLRTLGPPPSLVTDQMGQPSLIAHPSAADHAARPRQRFSWWRCAGLAAAACVALLVASSTDSTNHSHESPGSAIARIAHAKDARWTFHRSEDERVRSANEAAEVDSPLHPGTLELSRGVLRVDFAGGASVTLEAPSVLTLVSSSQARLQHGRLTAKAPPGAEGFTIDSRGMKIVDLGTVFGVAVDRQGAGEVLVFDGQVELSLPRRQANDDGSLRRLLAEGVAARVDAAQETIEEIHFNGEQFAQSWPITYGVLAATGVVKFVEPAPLINPSRYEDDDRLIVFPERESIDIRKDITVSIAAPGAYSGPFENLTAVVSPQRRLRSYLLQFNPIGRQLAPKRMVGTVTFDRPIAGIVCTNALLLETDVDLGSEEFERLTRGGRGIEDGDSLSLSQDRRTLTVDFTSIGASDQIRLLVDADSGRDRDTSNRPTKPVRSL